MTESQPTQIDFVEKFWTLLETNMGCMVPSYLKHILRVRGYDNASSIGTLTTNDIDEIQKYFRTKLKGNAVHNVDRKLFFHAYHNDGDDFEILPGHMKLLAKIVSFINTMTEEHGHAYFDPRVEKIVRKPRSKVMVRLNRIRGIHGMQVIDNTTQERATIAEPLIQTDNPPHVSLPVKSLVPPVFVENAGSPQPDDTADKFITQERAHLIDNIRNWMNKNTKSLYEKFSDQLVPEILEIVTETSQNATDNTVDNQRAGDDTELNEANELMVLLFRFHCPMCTKKIRAIQQENDNGETYFSASNIERHLKLHDENSSQKKPKKSKEKKKASGKQQTRKLRSNESGEMDTKKEDDVEYEVLTDEDEDGDSGEFKIVPKRKFPTRKN